MNLMQVKTGTEYTVSSIETEDEDLNAFLFSLGCYEGEPVTVISRQYSSCVIAI